MKETIIVAMSGGVDSSVSAYKLLKAGYNVIGVTLSMGRKCDVQAIKDAKLVAEKIGIEHYGLDVSKEFSNSVLDYFASSYMIGETPSPCVKCNKFIKFKFIIDFMKEKHADYIATGHYAKIIDDNGKYKLFKAENKHKDQSYFLAQLPYEYLQYIKFPLELIEDKEETRKIAEKIGLHNARKTDSQDICFVETNYKDFLKEYANITEKSGLIKHVNGTILGRHNGISNYTIGQRRGLGIAYKNPIYVVKFDLENNIVYVGDDEDLFGSEVYLKDFNQLDDIDENKNYTFKLRSTHIGQDGKIDLKNMVVKLNEPSRAITRGQLCCIYDGEQVVGSGWIK